MSKRSRLGTVENVCYAAQAAAAGLVLVIVAPLLAWLFGLMNETEAFGWAEVASLSLGIPTAVALLFVAILSLVNLARGPNRVRFRLVVWYLAGPGLLIASARLDPKRMNSYSPAYDALAATSLLVACVLPILWLRKSSHDQDGHLRP